MTKSLFHQASPVFSAGVHQVPGYGSPADVTAAAKRQGWLTAEVVNRGDVRRGIVRTIDHRSGLRRHHYRLKSAGHRHFRRGGNPITVM
jgi:hypothetical protein